MFQAFIIAYTSDFIPRMVYTALHGGKVGYIDHSLSIFNVSDFLPDQAPDNYTVETSAKNNDVDYSLITTCRSVSWYWHAHTHTCERQIICINTHTLTQTHAQTCIHMHIHTHTQTCIYVTSLQCLSYRCYRYPPGSGNNRYQFTM